MNRFKVLLVDDDARTLNFLSLKLKISGYDVITASNGFEAIGQVQNHAPDIVVLDVLMPGKDGFETLKEIRTFSSVPVIILSARSSNADIIKGLSLGADDYLMKPFSPDELVARIETVLRRVEPGVQQRISEKVNIGELTIDFKKHLVFSNGYQVHLTRIESLLLNELVRNSGRLVLYDELLSRVWGPEYRNDVQILRTWISRLRYKVEKDPNKPVLIRTIPKTGYIIDREI